MTKNHITLLAYGLLYSSLILSLTVSLLAEQFDTGTMYQVKYLKPKKKGYSTQVASFLKIDDAEFWSQIVEKQGAKDIQILVK